MNSDTGFAIAFFGLILVAALSAGSRQADESTTATSTGSGAETITQEPNSDTTISAPGSGSGAYNPTPAAPPAKTEEEIQDIEREISSIYRELDSLNEQLREAKLREPISPHAGKVTLARGDAQSFNRNEEYLELTADWDNIQDVALTGWSVQSYVTGVWISLPIGTRVPVSGGARVDAPITLRPGDEAYIHTGAPPAGFSFQENLCSGYLADEGDFYPRLENDCPVPLDELGRFGGTVARDRDCSDYVRSVRRCSVPTSTELREADVSRSCRSFVEDTLTYDTCVLLHRNDPAFSELGAWRIYLNQRSEIWRSEREIIRLLDSAGRVVDYVEY